MESEGKMQRALLTQLEQLPEQAEIMQIPIGVFVKSTGDAGIEEEEKVFFERLHALIGEKQPKTIKINGWHALNFVDSHKYQAVLINAALFLLISNAEHVCFDISWVSHKIKNDMLTLIGEILSTVRDRLMEENPDASFPSFTVKNGTPPATLFDESSPMPENNKINNAQPPSPRF